MNAKEVHVSRPRGNSDVGDPERETLALNDLTPGAKPCQVHQPELWGGGMVEWKI